MKHFFAFWCCLLPFGLYAQRALTSPPADAPRQVARTELLLDPDTDEVQVQALPADTAVVLLIRREKPGTRTPSYVFQHYGANLHLRRETPVEIPHEFEFQRLCAEPGIVYALFRAPDKTGRLLAVAYDAREGQLRLQPFDTKLCREIVSLKAMAGRLLANVTLNDQQHQTVLLLDVANGQFQFVPSLYEPLDTELTSVADRPAGHAEFVLSQSNGRKQRLQLKRLSAVHGQLLNSEFVQAESERSLLTAQLSPLGDTTTRLLAGTYGLRDLRYAQGLFATDLTARSATAARPALRFYDFKRFRHFFDYLKPSREARLRDRTARREAREASPVHWHYHMLLHELLPQPDGGYTLVGEVYTPQYNYSPYSSGLPISPYSMTGRNSLNAYSGGYNPYMNYGSNRNFIGFRTTQAVVCGFDKRGNLLWDNTFVVGPGLVRTALEEAVQPLALADGSLVLAYLLENELHYKRISQSEPAPNDSKVELLTSATSQVEKVLEVRQPELMPWKANEFVASGFQRIKVERGAERQVFFLQAVQF